MSLQKVYLYNNLGDPCQTMRIMIELIEKKLEELNLNDNEDIELKKI